jgi:hypothetical protein
MLIKVNLTTILLAIISTDSDLKKKERLKSLFFYLLPRVSSVAEPELFELVLAPFD